MPSVGLDFCGQCSRRVHNLDGMNDSEREAFFASCSGEVCVAYTVRRPHALAGVVSLGIAAALGVGASAAAKDSVPTVVTGPTCDPMAKGSGIDTIVVGGIKSAQNAKWLDERDAALPDAPQIGEIDAAEWLPVPDDANAAKPAR
jgi:hypothetical protein